MSTEHSSEPTGEPENVDEAAAPTQDGPPYGTVDFSQTATDLVFDAQLDAAWFVVGTAYKVDAIGNFNIVGGVPQVDPSWTANSFAPTGQNMVTINASLNGLPQCYAIGFVANAPPVVGDGPSQRFVNGGAHVGADVARYNVVDLADLREKLGDEVSHRGLQVDVRRRHVVGMEPLDAGFQPEPAGGGDIAAVDVVPEYVGSIAGAAEVFVSQGSRFIHIEDSGVDDDRIVKRLLEDRP